MLLPIGRGDAFTAQSIPRLKADGHGQWGGFKTKQLETKYFITFQNTHFSHKLTPPSPKNLSGSLQFLLHGSAHKLYFPLRYITLSFQGWTKKKKTKKTTATEWLLPSQLVNTYYQFYAWKTWHTTHFLYLSKENRQIWRQWAHLPPTPPSPTSCLSPKQPTNFQHFQICRLCNHADDLANSDHRFDQSPGAKRGFTTSAVPASDFT